ncbi:gas vesicle protein GvpO [Kitasatospora sp. NPDC001660]
MPEPRPRRPADHGDRETARRPRATTPSADGEHREASAGRSARASAPPDRAGAGERPRTDLPRRAVARAARQVQELTGRAPEGIASLERDQEGWRVGIEVLETRRVPDSTDILAVYQVVLDERGGLVSYRRERRYHRGRVDQGETP